MEVLKCFMIMFGVVEIPSLKILVSCLSACDDLLVLPNGKKMHVYVVRSCDDGEIWAYMFLGHTEFVFPLVQNHVT